jgi:hypothetical protein
MISSGRIQPSSPYMLVGHNLIICDDLIQTSGCIYIDMNMKEAVEIMIHHILCHCTYICNHSSNVTHYTSVKYNHLSLFKYSYMLQSIKTIIRQPLQHFEGKAKYNAVVFTLWEPLYLQ